MHDFQIEIQKQKQNVNYTEHYLLAIKAAGFGIVLELVTFSCMVQRVGCSSCKSLKICVLVLSIKYGSNSQRPGLKIEKILESPFGH